MSKRSLYLLPSFFFLSGLFAATLWSSDPPADAFGARLATFDKAAGESYFALSVTPQQRVTAAKVQDVVILVDTSASQTGLFREDSLLAVTTIVHRLDPQDRVKLFAVDLEAVALCDEFVEAGSKEMNEALGKLQQRTPLGATDLVLALQAAVDSWQGAPENPRAVIYVGDGYSRANFFGDLEIKTLVGKLVERRAPVSSLAIGPARSIEFLAVMANQTGGVLWLDSDEEASAQMAGTALAKAAQQTVFWPQDAQFSAGIAEYYPSQVPPLRTDRDTIIIGKLESHDPQTLTVKADAQGETVELSWSLAAERSNEDFAFLPKLVDMARDNGGLTLPTVGSAGLREVARVILAGAQELSIQDRPLPATRLTASKGTFHFCSFQEEPQDEPAAPAPPSDPAVPTPPAPVPVVVPPAPAPQAEPAAPAASEATTPSDDDLLSELNPQTKLLDDVQANRQVLAGRIQAEVEQGLDAARKQIGTDALSAIQALKVMLDNVDRAPELDPEIRGQLRDRIVTAIREAGRRQVELDEVRRQGQENRAIADEARRLSAEFTDRRQRVKQLMEKFDALVDEGISLAMSGENRLAEANFDAAISEIADPVELLLPFDSIGVAARYNAGILRQLTGNRKFRELRHRGFVNALYEVERAAIPFGDEPPIVYPDPEFWERISIAREKYKSMDLLGSGTPEKRIYDALDQETILEFNESPLSEVIDFIKNAREIPIVIDRRALDDVGMGSDTPVTISLAGITLRSALKIMLKELDLTYVISDEVLKITTPEEAENELLTKVYPVADLVLPIISGGGMGGMMGGGMGGMGGGMGGMGGGMGGMGGGMGGMGGMGMGGMGGMFAVEDDLKLGAAAGSEKPATAAANQAAAELPAASAMTVKPTEPITLELKDGQSSAEAWDDYFARHKGDRAQKALELDGQIRATAHRLSEKESYADIVTMLQSAIRNSLAQPWMYEALGLAMMATDAPQSDVERALMSAVDLTNSQDEAMNTAVYMARVGLDRRALLLFREIAYASPFRPEPYALGLACAKRLDDIDGIRWATLGILGQAWPEDQSGIEDRALRLAKATVERLRQDNRSDEADTFEAAIEDARVRDVTVKVTWTGDADVDLMMEEPAGTVCSLQSPRTTAGGVMLGDAYAAGKETEGYTETYVCPKGFSGKYRLLVHRVWGKVTAGKVTVDIQTRNADRPHIHNQIPLGEKDAMVMFDVQNGRRTEHLAGQQIARLQTPVVQTDRAALSRQLNRYEDSLARRDYRAARAQQRGWSGGGPVGFQPQITTLPQGAMLSGIGSLAVVSADRRYVRTSPLPFFSQIGDVSSFDFGGGINQGLPDDDDDDDDNNNNNN